MTGVYPRDKPFARKTRRFRAAAGTRMVVSLRVGRVPPRIAATPVAVREAEDYREPMPAWVSEEATTDIVAASDAFARSYGALEVEHDARAPFFASQSFVSDDRMSASHVRWSGEMRAAADAWPVIAVARLVRAERYRWEMGRESGDGMTPFVIPVGRAVHFEYADIESVAVSISVPEFVDTARRILDVDEVRLRDDDGVNRPLRPTAELTAVIDEYARDLELTRLALDNALLRVTRLEMLVASLITTLPVVTAAPAPISRGSAVGYPAVRRAAAFIDDNADRAIGEADVAAAARIPLEALRAAFLASTGETPAQYLRRARLAAAKRDLKAAGDRAAAGVVAARWGAVDADRLAQEVGLRGLLL